jgi:hypothetical protein
VIYEQIEVYRGVRTKAWNGDFVDHLRIEANHSLAWLADRCPKLVPPMILAEGLSAVPNGDNDAAS